MAEFIVELGSGYFGCPKQIEVSANNILDAVYECLHNLTRHEIAEILIEYDVKTDPTYRSDNGTPWQYLKISVGQS